MHKWTPTKAWQEWADKVEGDGVDVTAGHPPHAPYPDEHFIADLTIAKRGLGTSASNVFNALGVNDEELEQWLTGEDLPSDTVRKNVIHQAKKQLKP